jgi:predicted CoA-binding protein
MGDDVRRLEHERCLAIEGVRDRESTTLLENRVSRSETGCAVISRGYHEDKQPDRRLTKEPTMTTTRQRVVVLGASDNPERYSNMALNRLLENGHEVIPVHPKLRRIGDLKVVPTLADVGDQVDTLTVYVSQKVSSSLADAIVELAPGRVIFNPGAENTDLEAILDACGITALRACTLVLLSTGQF